MENFCWLRKGRVSTENDVGAVASFFAYVSSQERYLRQLSKELGLSLDKLKVLVYLKECPDGAFTSEIASFYGFKRSNLSKSISALRANGLISVKFANCYGQYGILNLLPEGEQVIEKLKYYCFCQKKDNKAFLDFVGSTQ